MPTANERKKVIEDILDGGNGTIQSEREITDTPQNFKQWLADNEQRIANKNKNKNRTLPYFLKDNGKVTKNGFKYYTTKQRLICQREKEYQQLKNYKNVKFDKKTGALKAKHIGHIETHQNDNQRFFGNLTNTDLENACQQQLFDMGHRAILRNETILDANGEYLPVLDLELDSKIMDIRSVTSNGDTTIFNIISSKSKQMRNVYKKTGIYSDSLCLYFHDETFFDLAKVKEAFDEYYNLGGRRIKRINCVVRGETKLIIVQ